MADTVKSWLAHRIAGIDSIQKCLLNQPDADIVVHSWRGVLIHVHIINNPLKTRQLKKMVQEATRVGIGTLLIVNSALLPPDGAKVFPEEWLLAVHTLTDEKIYAYDLDDNGPHIRQVHLRQTTRADEREVWYGPEIPIQQMPFFRIWVKSPSAIKGDWLVANFAADPFWRNQDYRNARAAHAEQARKGRQTEFYTWSSGGANGEHQFVYTPNATDPRLTQSCDQLGLTTDCNCDEIKSAFRKLALELHPDTSKLPKDEAEAKFRAVKDAYLYLKSRRRCP